MEGWHFIFSYWDWMTQCNQYIISKNASLTITYLAGHDVLFVLPPSSKDVDHSLVIVKTKVVSVVE